jgi:DNA invertase Pin-like site-specific DNA recombinase
MEVLDKHGVSFVSVTQQFHTTSSLSRLTLNILLSFAQFRARGDRRAHQGQDVSRTARKAPNKLYRYYVCVNAHQKGYNQCPTRSASAPPPHRCT